MRIVRPYGSSRSKEPGGGLHRVLVEKTAGRAEHDVSVFARSHDELVIAQWISAIDKIARKPVGSKKPSPGQRAFRHKLGNACWMRLTGSGHLQVQGAKDERRASLADLWWSRIHPYGNGTAHYDPDKAPKIEGRWYEVFAGEGCKPESAGPGEVAGIAARIETHLHEREYRLGRDVPTRRKGKIEIRAGSISACVLRRQDPGDGEDGLAMWTAKDVQAYTPEDKDPVRAIYEEAVRLEGKRKRISLQVAGERLFGHWGEVFRDPGSGEPMNVKDAKKEHPGMFALHMQIKQCYRRLLKRTRKDTREHRKKDPNGRKLSALLPRDIVEAVNLSARQHDNADLGHLVRLGKVIHYGASDGSADHPRAIGGNWPKNVDCGRFWTSEGQAEIKRAEAFVRIWRQALVLAGLTLKDWVSMKAPFEGDILGGEKELNKALDPGRFERGHFDRKLLVLFGGRTGLFPLQTDAECLELLRGLIKGTASLRHASFHFTGRQGLLDKLAALPANFPTLMATAQQLWRVDAADRTERLKTALRGAHAEHFLSPRQAAQVFGLLTGEGPAELPLPRLSRVLKRAEGAWDKDKTIELPKRANRRALEDPSRLCQYTVLKLIYERPFRSWLKDQSAAAISGWIDRAIARTTEEAKRMNAKGDETRRRVIVARADILPRPSAGSDVIDFFSDLSAATASEMRVQRGYESDGGNAREQAGYIDDLLCDVVILSFSHYLSAQNLKWVLELTAMQAPSEVPTCSLSDLHLQEPEPALDAHDWHHDWQAALYLLLHLLPVESTGRLLHQLRKWDVTAHRDSKLTPDDEDRLQRLFATMTLYLDMHNAKFEGGDALAGCTEFKVLFESAQGFDRVFSQASSPETDRRIPRRGLREIMRFGHLPLLKTVTRGMQIGDATIERVFRLEAPVGGTSKIAALQQRREELHDLWVDRKRKLDAAGLQEYCETVAAISQHRQDSNLVNLVDHVRTHRIIMGVVGRLVDYMGLFERDLYFATLALLHRRDLRPDDLFEKKGLEYLLNGQIIFAFNHRKSSLEAVEVLKELERHFTDLWGYSNRVRKIRNDLAHCNMLQGAAPAAHLTHWVNETRVLMVYDRKLKNAVSKSVIELLARDGIELRWDMKINGEAHDLANAGLSSGCATHLGGDKHLVLRAGGSKTARVQLKEKLHSDGYIQMIATAFDGKPRWTASIVEDLSKVDWTASTEERSSDGGQAGA